MLNGQSIAVNWCARPQDLANYMTKTEY